ncbi:MAG: serpin family protein [Bacteroidota bacterium]
MKTTAIFLLAGILLFSCESENTSPKGIKEIKLSATDNSVVNASNQLGFDMMQDIVANAEEHENLLISPLSISYALNMTHNGAKEETKTEMAQSMNLEGIPLPEVNESYRHLTESLQNADNKVTMEIANSIWYRDTYPVEDEFIQVNQDYYDAEVSPLDFSNTEAAKETMNNWVANKTHDKIDKIVEYIDPLDVMFLMNAVYFKGQWKHTFNEDKTAQRSFYPRDGEMIQVPTMNIEKDFLFLENDFCTGVELPYGRGNFSMVLLLPDEGQQPEDIINNLSSDSWDNLLNSADTTEILVSLPKFKFSYKKMLNQTLKNLGMEKAFDENEANFEKINRNGDLYISRVNHKSFIDVNEEGTEAAAVTSVGVSTTSMPDNINFNRPFVFAIREQSTNTILFSGIVERPEY